MGIESICSFTEEEKRQIAEEVMREKRIDVVYGAFWTAYSHEAFPALEVVLDLLPFFALFDLDKSRYLAGLALKTSDAALRDKAKQVTEILGSGSFVPEYKARLSSLCQEIWKRPGLAGVQELDDAQQSEAIKSYITHIDDPMNPRLELELYLCCIDRPIFYNFWYNQSIGSFLESWLNSRYVHIDADPDQPLRPKEDIMKELKAATSSQIIDYEKLKTITGLGQASSIEDIIDCSRFKSENEVFMRRLGEGSFGSTYMAASREMAKTLAIKVIENPSPDSIESIAMAFINHPNIVRYYYSGKNLIKKDGKPVYTIIMDFVDGKTVREYVKLVNKVPLDEIHKFASQLFDAALYLEDNGMRHGDIHFNNAIITPKRDIMLVDLGLASSCKQPSPYLPNRRFGGPDDFVSIAQLLYFMATGEHLFALSPSSTITGTDIADDIAQERARVMADSGGELLEEYKHKICLNIPTNPPSLTCTIIVCCLIYGCATNKEKVKNYRDTLRSYAEENSFAENTRLGNR